MICFLTSNPFTSGTGLLSDQNGQLELMTHWIGPGKRLLYVASNPSDTEANDRYATLVQEAFCNAGLPFSAVTILDSRNGLDVMSLVRKSDVLFLAGGHVPTQNSFFFEIGLQDAMEEFDGVVIGVSAGSMNSASCVYAMPEEDGEAIDYDFYRFIPGLSLTDRMIIPHYEQLKKEYVDGLRAMEDIAYQDSVDREFMVLQDGSFLFGEHGAWSVHGEAYILQNGVMTLLCADGETCKLGSYGR